MKNIRLAACFLLLIMTVSCAGRLPDRQSVHGLVAIPFQVVNRSDFPFMLSFELKSSKDENFSIVIEQPPLNNDLVISGLIPEGRYEVDTIVMINRNAPGVLVNQKRVEKRLDYPFEMNIESGKIILISKILRFEQYQEHESIKINSREKEFTEQIEKEYRKKIRNMENSQGWEIITDS